MTLPALAFISYLVLLAVLAGAVLLSRTVLAMKRVALAMVLNAAIAIGFTMATQQSDPWWFFMGLDFLTALVVLIQPAGRAQALIGWTYVAQIAVNTGYALNGASANAVARWWLITAIAFLQLLLVGGWLAYDKGYRLRGVRGARARAAAAHRARVEE
jgi:hypothetical protein